MEKFGLNSSPLKGELKISRWQKNKSKTELPTLQGIAKGTVSFSYNSYVKFHG